MLVYFHCSPVNVIVTDDNGVAPEFTKTAPIAGTVADEASDPKALSVADVAP